MEPERERALSSAAAAHARPWERRRRCGAVRGAKRHGALCLPPSASVKPNAGQTHTGREGWWWPGHVCASVCAAHARLFVSGAEAACAHMLMPLLSSLLPPGSDVLYPRDFTRHPNTRFFTRLRKYSAV
jgi:hypothetical protein